jgi:hypothetical protein
MSQLEIRSFKAWDAVSQDETLHVSFVVDGIQKASFSLPVHAEIWEVVSQIERALQSLPKEITMTTEAVKGVLNLLVPELAQRVTIAFPSLREVENHLQAVVEKLEHNFREVFSVPNSWTRMESLLRQNNYYHYLNRCFDFGDFLLGNGVFSTLYNGSYSRAEAKRILKNNMHSGNVWDKTLDEVISVLIKSGFPISE